MLSLSRVVRTVKISRECCRLQNCSSEISRQNLGDSFCQFRPDCLIVSHFDSNLQPSRSLHCNSQVLRMPVSGYTIEEKGTENTTSLKVFVKDKSGEPISPFHDIPLVANEAKKTFHVVIEVPRWTNAKMEIDTSSPLHPIIQDTKKGKLRYVANSYPYKGYIWNYGCFPQTWENPNHRDVNTGENGDDDPVDICEIGHRVANRGDVLEVKVLGILAMIDDGETDWKVIVIDVDDPLASSLNNLEDVEKHMPGFLNDSREWFRIYKMPDGKPENNFAFNGEYKDAEFAHSIIQETHTFWKQLVGLAQPSQGPGKIDVSNVLVDGSSKQISRSEASEILGKAGEFQKGEAIPNSVDTWYFSSRL